MNKIRRIVSAFVLPRVATGLQHKASVRTTTTRSNARLLLMLLLPVALISGALAFVQIPSLGTKASAQTQNTPQVAPPSGLQITPLDSSLHVTWTPSSDPATMWHVVSVWDGAVLQQAK